MLLEELQVRYELGSKKAVYDRLKALNIKLPKKNRKSYAPPETVEQLDKLQDHLDAGGTLSNFNEGVVTSYEVIESENALDVIESDNTLQLSNDTSELAYLVQTIAHSITPPDPLLPNRRLAEAAQQHFILNTNQIRAIIGINPPKPEFERYGYSIKRVGKEGNQYTWRVITNQHQP